MNMATQTKSRPVALGIKGVQTADYVCRFYFEIVDKNKGIRRYQRIEPQRMKEIFNRIYPGLKVELHRTWVENAIESLNQN